ncbi:HEPN domain-containing protein [bacterium]|nr:MAG: HEPN domain-containing protein [bacterium]
MPGIKDWLRKASNDLIVAKMSSSNEEVGDVTVYLAHQCAEKALKTYLVFCKKPVLKSHDLEKILEECAQADSSFKTLENEALFLNPYGVYSRYPDDRFFVDQEDIKQAISMANKILNFVEKKVTALPKNNLPLFEK